MTASLDDLAQKAASGQALSPADAHRLADTTDLVSVGMIATDARRARVGETVTYVRVLEMPYDATVPGDGWPAGARELRITGEPPSAEDALAGAHRLASAWGLASAGATAATAATAATNASAAATAAVNATAADKPSERQVTAFSLAHLWTLAGRQASRLTALARALRDAGVTAVADVAIDTFSADDLPPALDALLSGGLLAPVAGWIDAPTDPVAAYDAFRATQARIVAFKAVAPLPRRRPAPADTPSTGYDDVKLVALARVMIDNVEHVQVDWAVHGPKLAQVTLLFGASDFDRVSPQDESALGHRRAPIEEVRRNISAAFLRPVERDARFVRIAADRDRVEKADR